MKSYILCTIFLSLSLFCSAQWYGDGQTPATAFYGIINDANPIPQWNTTNFPTGIVYVGRIATGQNDLEIGNGGNLSIREGITIRFCSTISDLKITGSGKLDASGSASQPIVFTKNDQSFWGHVSFEGSTGISLINYCTITNGQKYGSGVEGYGGGIHINTSNLTLSNCEIKDNKSTFGGGIFINQNVSPVIRNCKILNNQSTSSGGGLYSWIGSSPLIINCIISGNRSTAGGGGGGIFLGRNAGNVRIVNCTIVNNSAAGSGQNIHMYINTDALRPSFINCIIWNPANSIYYTTQTPQTSDFINCAIQNPVAGSTTSSISLGAVNTENLGPNFNQTDGSDWSINVLSPCINTGLDSYGSPNIVPATDFNSNPRVMITDIGAYEAQFSRWKLNALTSEWSNPANWDGGLPSSVKDVLIPSNASNYPIIPPGSDFQIGANHMLILQPGARATLNNLTNNGSLRMLANATGLSSLIMNSYTKGPGSTESMQIYLSGGYIGNPEYNEGRWHYISSPVQGTSTDIFTEYIFDFARWVDGIQGESMREGWVAYDGFAYLIDDPSSPPSSWFGYPYRFNSMNLGQGYNYFRDENATYSISGQLNTSNVQVQLKYAGESEDANGWNLVGNPFTSGLDWDYITSNTPFPPYTSQAIQFTKDNELFYYVAGVMVPDMGLPPTGVIPPMQGFFVKTYQNNVTLSLPAAARTNDDIPQRYKGSTAEIPLIRLSLADTSSSDETVVRFAEDAKTGIDFEYDALKMFIPTNKVTIYSVSDGKNYAVNGQPFPAEGSIIEIPLTVAVYTVGEQILNVKAVQGLDGYKVTLTDLIASSVTDLKTTNAVSFTSSATGFINNRFVLKISTTSTGIEEPLPEKSSFNIYHAMGMINIQAIADLWDGQVAGIRVINLAGRRIYEADNVMLSRNSVTQIPAPSVKGLYIVEIKSGLNKHVGKVIVR